MTAALKARTVKSGSLGGGEGGARLGPRVGRLGIHSALSLPLLLPGQVVGAINVYARGTDVFRDHAELSPSEHTKLADIAPHIVDEAVRRARHTNSCAPRTAAEGVAARPVMSCRAA